MGLPNFFAGPALGIYAIVACLLLLLIKPWVSSLRSIPGPFLARYTRLWLFKEAYFWDLSANQRPIVRIAPNEYSIDDPAAAKIIYGSGKGFRKSPWYQASGNPYGTVVNIFTEADPHAHAGARRKIATIYSMSSLVQLEAFVDDCTAVLKQRLGEIANTGTSIDVSHWMQCYAFDVIGKITVGERFGFLDSGEDIQGIMTSLGEYLRYCSRIGIFSEWRKTLYRLRMTSSKVSGIRNVSRFALSQLDAKCAKFQACDEKNADPRAPADVITKLLRIQDTDSSKISRAEIMSTCVMNVGAGSDTTSIAFSSVIYSLLKYPETLARLRDEIREFAEAQKVPYLQAVVKETLRVHPAMGLPLGRVVPSEGATLAEQYSPPGTVMGINSWAAHANRHVFGEDADIFRPERWLNEDEDVVRKREAYFMAVSPTFDMIKAPWLTGCV
ncbi:cytochrome P450 [Parathielavia hyrcaniae]|uniref:Cytochrome P450 n=1 Tax=Parathielavia hyrcaniae TaxID=113614 RepID=A0AAN6SYY2_9PEZI|nr:cytochrome P450 [Parathielavia hyrcaniae]